MDRTSLGMGKGELWIADGVFNAEPDCMLKHKCSTRLSMTWHLHKLGWGGR